MTAVFGHGRLRLYLLSLLEESPRHGYELITLLEDRFMGLYAPSAGTIYPRLQRMEADGLVTHTVNGGRKVYHITQAGRDELDSRRDELADLESDIHTSVHGLAREIRAEIRDTARDLRDELKHAAREVRRQQRHQGRQRRHEGWGHWEQAWSAWTEYTDPAWSRGEDKDERRDERRDERKDRDRAKDWDRDDGDRRRVGPSFERLVWTFLGRTRKLMMRAQLTESQLRECMRILDDAFERIRDVLRESDPQHKRDGRG